MVNNIYNPFCDSGIANYNQFKKYSFIKFGIHNTITNRINQQISQIKQGYYFGERFILIADRGLGKTSTLYYIRDLLQDNVPVYLLSNLPMDVEDFIHKITFNMTSRDKLCHNYRSLHSFDKPVYILIDFPDTIPSTYSKFLGFLWNAISHANQDKINFLFAMNQFHYDKSFAYSQILGKFVTLRLEKLNYEETKELVQSRLDLIKKETGDIFTETVLALIYEYSKGVPRNIVSGCGLLFDQYADFPISIDLARKILKDKYYSQVIKDRVEDSSIRLEYNTIIHLLENDYDGRAMSKMELVKQVQERTNLGQVTASKRIDDLQRFGILSIKRGGHNRLYKTVSLVR